MNGYSYSPVTGEYVSAVVLRQSPLEPGVYLVPAHCTTTAPPEPLPGLAACWTGEGWTLVEDHRGEVLWDEAGQGVTIAELGPVPDGLSSTPPESDPNAAVDAQILALEALQTPRRLREAALTAAGKAWLADLEARIAALRAQRV
jgi:hypothetical protein